MFYFEVFLNYLFIYLRLVKIDKKRKEKKPRFSKESWAIDPERELWLSDDDESNQGK